ncbi:MAG: hypothetical protein K6E20_06875 [Acholeplasmatales bacterium]|nr:hypothetical protein [Acholeplasmatales bacterium]
MLSLLLSCQKNNDNDTKIDSIIVSSKAKVEVKAKYNDDYFDDSSYEFNLKRMKSSYVLANASNSKEDASSFLTQAGFSNIYSNDAYDDTKTDSIAYTIASRKIDDDILISCAIRGFNYGLEWYSNFQVGESGVHTGFSEAKDKVIRGIIEYINDNNLNDSSIKFWITGYSRGGAVSNLVTKSLNQYAYYKTNNKLYNDINFDYDYSNVSFNLKLDDIYCDTFEAPTVDTEENINKLTEINKNIFNGINPDDWITKIPSYLKRYGIDKNITLNVDSEDLRKKASEFGLEDIGTFREVNMLNFPVSSITQNFYFNSFDSYIKAAGIKDRQTYYDTYQTSISTVMSYFINLGPESLSTIISFAKDNPDFLKEFGVESETELLWQLAKDKIKLSDVILKYLDYNKISYDELVVESFYVFDSLVSQFVKNDTDTKIHTATLMYNINNIVDDHYSELNYAYLLLYKE